MTVNEKIDAVIDLVLQYIGNKYETAMSYGGIIDQLIELQNEEPTADDEPEKTGEWVLDDMGQYKCSVCGALRELDGQLICFDCGARMDGKPDEGSEHC